MRKKIVLFIVSVFILGIVIWFINQNVDEGYVYDSEDGSVWVMKLSKTEIKGKKQMEIQKALEEKASESKGTFYEIPAINRITKTKFEKGNKVKIYWSGNILQSSPSQVHNTSLIIKISK